MDQKEIMKKVFESVVNPDIKETGRTFTEKEVAVIMAVVSIMVGDPKPGDNAKFYHDLIDYIKLPTSLENHMMSMILSSRQALKEVLIMQMAQSNQHTGLKEIEELLKSINNND